MDAENGRLLARAVKAEEEEAELLRERRAERYREVAETHARIPVPADRVDLRAPADRPGTTDPLVRLFAALVPRR
jgi:hypothetical protein